MSINALQIDQVSKTYHQNPVLNQISLSIEPGEFFALLGPNGAGKTTLISILAGLVRADSGKVQVMGFDVQAQSLASRRQIGVVPQELVFDPFFTVRETLRWQSGYFGISKNDDWIDEILHHLGLSDKAESNMRTLSGGMKRRVIVAQALVHRPPVIVLDEPTAGVDVQLRQDLWKFIRQLNQQGHTILLTTHYLEEAQTLCNRVAIMHKGHLVAVDKTDVLLANHQQNFLQATLAVDAQWLVSKLPNAHVLEQSAQATRISIAYESVSDLTQILSDLQSLGDVSDVHLQKPDLESVFLHFTQSNTSARA